MPWTLKGAKERAFSLIDLLIALAVVSSLTATLLLSRGDTKDASARIREEADNFAFWLRDRMTLARTEEAVFRIISCSPSRENAKVNIQWLGGACSNKTESYKGDKINYSP